MWATAFSWRQSSPLAPFSPPLPGSPAGNGLCGPQDHCRGSPLRPVPYLPPSLIPHLPLPPQVMAFVAPKIIGGARAPSPVGELGFVEMTQAVQIEDVKWQQV